MKSITLDMEDLKRVCKVFNIPWEEYKKELKKFSVFVRDKDAEREEFLQECSDCKGTGVRMY